MARTGRPKAELAVTDDDRSELQRLARRPSTPQSMALRSRIVLACADGASNKDVAEQLGISTATVGKWRKRYIADGIAGLSDEPRPGRERTLTDDIVEDLLDATRLEKPTDGGTHWTSRMMARRMGVSQTSVVRIWRAYGLQPHRIENHKLSTDEFFVDKVHDVVGLYLNPPERAVVLCVDEKSQIQALDRTRPCLPMLPTTPARRTHDYVRHGVTSLFAALDTATGHVHHALHSRHRSIEFVSFLDQIDREVPEHLDIHVVLDNYATHKTPAVKKWLLRHPRVHLHFTPTSSSWLNLVERFFAEVEARVLRRGQHSSVEELEADLRSWLATWNQNPRPYVWTRTADDIFNRLAGYLTALHA